MLLVECLARCDDATVDLTWKYIERKQYQTSMRDMLTDRVCNEMMIELLAN
jgi:Fe-S-cluster containining protein